MQRLKELRFLQRIFLHQTVEVLERNDGDVVEKRRLRRREQLSLKKATSHRNEYCLRHLRSVRSHGRFQIQKHSNVLASTFRNAKKGIGQNATELKYTIHTVTFVQFPLPYLFSLMLVRQQIVVAFEQGFSLIEYGVNENAVRVEIARRIASLVENVFGSKVVERRLSAKRQFAVPFVKREFFLPRNIYSPPSGSKII